MLISIDRPQEARATHADSAANKTTKDARRRMAESSALAFQRSHVSAIVLARAKNLRAAVKKKRVLDEDEFTDVLDGIIRRDFFPDLAVLDAQHALLDALEAGDQAAATAAYKRLVPANAGGSARAPKRPRHSRSAAAAVDTPASLASGWEAPPPRSTCGALDDEADLVLGAALGAASQARACACAAACCCACAAAACCSRDAPACT